MNPTESISLEYREGTSDKLYQASIVPHGDGYAVSFAYGRRGTTLQPGTKHHTPVSREEAKKTFDKLVREKLAKGYQKIGQPPAYLGNPTLRDDSGIRPQLLNPIDESKAQELIRDPQWATQEKLDGRRMLLQRVGNSVTAINRKGQRVDASAPILLGGLGLRGEYLLDGEAVGDTFYAFDLLELNGENLRPQPFRRRLDELGRLLQSRKLSGIQLVPTARISWEKEAMFETLRGERREGIVFKHVEATYTEGRPASGGSQLKLKFVETASCLVAAHNGKRSVALSLLNGEGQRVAAGNVTILPNHPVPEIGCVVEVRYLYAYRESGCLYQPVYLGVRDDIDSSECLTSQLKFKAAPIGTAA